MIAILEIACVVFGIIALIKGEFPVTRNRIIIGAPARIIGALLTCFLPIAMIAGFAFGLVFAITNPAIANDPDELNKFLGGLWWLDLAVGAVLISLIVLVSAVSKKYSRDEVVNGKLIGPVTVISNQTIAIEPVNSSNPYQAPQR